MTTNYEKIKAMSIDEMANTLKYINFLIFMGGYAFDVKQWLEQESEEE